MEKKLKTLFLLSLFSSVALADPTILQVKYKNIVVLGKSAKVMTITQPDGTWGYYAKAGESFNIIVQNKLDQPTVIHWHGLILPNSQDGTELTQKVIAPNAQYSYNFKLANIGTFWMHSHYELQEALFAEAPLIIESPQDSAYQQILVMFQDFTFKSPAQVLQGLTSTKPAMDMGGMDMHDMPGMKMDDMSKHGSQAMDLNDVNYEAYLTNYQTPQDPQITLIKPDSQIKLRFINGSSGSNFWINLGSLSGTAVAVDGHEIVPIKGSKFQLAIAQRIDIVVQVPKQGGTFPIIGQVEGLKEETGLILTTHNNLNHTAIPALAKVTAPALNNIQEIKLHSQEKLTNKKVDQIIKYTLTGDMSSYIWQINNQSWPNVTPAKIQQGNRVELDFINKSMMAHPMHLHGYGFKIIEINGKKIDGAVRDTILVLPKSTVKVIFDAVEPGKWFIHCHMLYHMHRGMMTYLEVIPKKASTSI